MFYFHQNNQSHGMKNYVLTPQYYVLPKQSGILATEEDVTDNTLISMVEKPIITFPANNSVDYNNNINFTSYERNPLYSGDKTHMSIQVAYDIGFTNLYSNVKVSDTDINLATRYLPVDISSATVYIRIKYHSGLYSSPWSDPIKVTTKKFEIGTPKILTPTDGATGISKNIVISTSPFSYVGISEIHESTTYQVAQDINFNTILLNTTETTNLTSFIASMEEGKTYFIRVRHNGKKYGSSNWSQIFKVSTLVPVSPLANSFTITCTHSNNLYKTARLQINNDGTTRTKRRDDSFWIAGPKLFENKNNEILQIELELLRYNLGGTVYNSINDTIYCYQSGSLPTDDNNGINRYNYLQYYNGATIGLYGQANINIYKTYNKSRIYGEFNVNVYNMNRVKLFTILVNFGFAKG